MSNVQVIIVGQGFAGTAVAWTLASRGIDFVIVDSGNTQTSSRIAAGLVTPITGMRAVKTWEWDKAWNRAQCFYPEIERRTNTQFWNVQSSLRLFDSEEERTRIVSRWPNYPELVSCYKQGSLDQKTFDQSYGGMTMNVAARLDGLTYLEASREAFLQRNAYHHRSLDLKNDIEIDKESIAIPALNIRARKLLFCQGYSSESNPWFSNLPLVPAQGDILTVDIPNFFEARTIHRKIWITPLRNNPTEDPTSRYLIGSTYRWHPLDGLPSLVAKEEILSKLSSCLNCSYEVVDHRSAVRPTSYDQKPLMGSSLIDPRVWILNGLGAKGTLMAPWCAEQLVDALLGRNEVRSSLFWDRRRR